MTANISDLATAFMLCTCGDVCGSDCVVCWSPTWVKHACVKQLWHELGRREREAFLADFKRGFSISTGQVIHNESPRVTIKRLTVYTDDNRLFDGEMIDATVNHDGSLTVTGRFRTGGTEENPKYVLLSEVISNAQFRAIVPDRTEDEDDMSDHVFQGGTSDYMILDELEQLTEREVLDRTIDFIEGMGWPLDPWQVKILAAALLSDREFFSRGVRTH